MLLLLVAGRGRLGRVGVPHGAASEERFGEAALEGKTSCASSSDAGAQVTLQLSRSSAAGSSSTTSAGFSASAACCAARRADQRPGATADEAGGDMGPAGTAAGQPGCARAQRCALWCVVLPNGKCKGSEAPEPACAPARPAPPRQQAVRRFARGAERGAASRRAMRERKRAPVRGKVGGKLGNGAGALLGACNLRTTGSSEPGVSCGRGTPVLASRLAWWAGRSELSEPAARPIRAARRTRHAAPRVSPHLLREPGPGALASPQQLRPDSGTEGSSAPWSST